MRYRRLLSAALAVLLLTGCGAKTQEPAAPQPEPEQEVSQLLPVFTRDDLPRLNGSTSTVPLAVAVCARLLGESPDDVSDLIHFEKTTNAYFSLLEGSSDLLIVGEANQEVLDEKEARGFEWEKTPFATDAFVFVVNEANPVDSITVEQARDIYTGRITNWKQLGGEDREIVALQRNQGAGSQTLMEKLVMQGEPMIEAPTDSIVTTMGQLMEAVKSYDGSPGAIGYSVYYYAQEMKMAQGLKMLKLEGVEPTPATIRSEEYPLVNPKYVVIDAKAAPDSPTRILYDWLLGEDGQRMIAQEGYVSILDMEYTPKTTPLIGSRWYENYIDHLLPRDDYGLLVPYAGLRLADDWPAHTGCLYGLMTTDGVVVTEPVYASVSYPSDRLMVLTSADGARAVAASDGSWCGDFIYDGVRPDDGGLSLLRGDAIDLMDYDGTLITTLTAADCGMEPELWHAAAEETFTFGDGLMGEWVGDWYLLDWTDRAAMQGVRYYDLTDSQCRTASTAEWQAHRESVWADKVFPEDVPGYQLVQDAILRDEVYILRQDTYENETHTTSYFRKDETPLPGFSITGDTWYQQISMKGGLLEKLDINSASYYRLDDLTCVFQTTLGYEPD